MQKKSVGIAISLLSLIGIGLISVSALNKPSLEADFERINAMPIQSGGKFDPVLAQKKAAEINKYAKAFPDDVLSAKLIYGVFGNIPATLDQTLTLKGQLGPAFQKITQKQIYESELSMAIFNAPAPSGLPISISEANIPIFITAYKDSLNSDNDAFLLAERLMDFLGSHRYTDEIEVALIQATKEIAKTPRQQDAINLVVELRDQLGKRFTIHGEEWPTGNSLHIEPTQKHSIILFVVQSEKFKLRLERISQVLQFPQSKSFNIFLVTNSIPTSAEPIVKSLQQLGVQILTAQSNATIIHLDPTGMDACLITLDNAGNLNSFMAIEAIYSVFLQEAERTKAVPHGN